jgi:hypothetical protein
MRFLTSYFSYYPPEQANHYCLVPAHEIDLVLLATLDIGLKIVATYHCLFRVQTAQLTNPLAPISMPPFLTTPA